MDKTVIAQRVATKLFATENAVDAAILEASQLLASLVEARTEVGVSAVLGQDCFTKVSVALSALTESRQAMVEAHHAMNETKLRLGIRTRMAGTGPKSFMEPGEHGDNVVEHRRAS